jgi:hypothetical protein
VLLLGRKYLTRVTFSHDENAVENLATDAADDPFALRVHPRSSRRSRNHTQLFCLEYGVERVTILTARSRSRKRRDSILAPSSPTRLLACCTAHSRLGCAVTPVMCRRLVPCSRNASAYRRAPSTVSMWKKSAAMISSACAVQTLPPPRATSPRRRIDAHAVQDLPDRRGTQAMAKPNQLAMDPPMTPLRILSASRSTSALIAAAVEGHPVRRRAV